MKRITIFISVVIFAILFQAKFTTAEINLPHDFSGAGEWLLAYEDEDNGCVSTAKARGIIRLTAENGIVQGNMSGAGGGKYFDIQAMAYTRGWDTKCAAALSGTAGGQVFKVQLKASWIKSIYPIKSGWETIPQPQHTSLLTGTLELKDYNKNRLAGTWFLQGGQPDVQPLSGSWYLDIGSRKPPESLPNLTFGAVAVSSNPVTEGENIQLSYTIINQGEEKISRPVIVKVLLNDIPVATGTTASLAPGSEHKENISIKPVSLGNNPIQILIDPDNYIDESVEDDNARRAVVLVRQKESLQFEELLYSPKNSYVYDDVKFTVKLKNVGSRPLTNVKLQLYEKDIKIGEVTFNRIVTFQTHTLTTGSRICSAGRHKFRAMASGLAADGSRQQVTDIIMVTVGHQPNPLVQILKMMETGVKFYRKIVMDIFSSAKYYYFCYNYKNEKRGGDWG